jgi:hypothetical protein
MAETAVGNLVGSNPTPFNFWSSFCVLFLTGSATHHIRVEKDEGGALRVRCGGGVGSENQAVIFTHTTLAMLTSSKLLLRSFPCFTLATSPTFFHASSSLIRVPAHDIHRFPPSTEKNGNHRPKLLLQRRVYPPTKRIRAPPRRSREPNRRLSRTSPNTNQRAESQFGGHN